MSERGAVATWFLMSDHPVAIAPGSDHMLLAVDIGNSNIKFCIYHGEVQLSRFSIPTERNSTKGSFEQDLAANVREPITKAIICSVVPEINVALTDAISAAFGIAAIIVKNDFDFGIQINYQPLAAAGTDRLVNVFSAVEKYGVPLIVCSFGTALTMDVVSRDRVLKGGLIAPGIKLLSAALKLATSQLPEVEIERPGRIVQNTTVGSIQSGIFNGYIGLVEGLLNGIKEEIGESPKVIATGGFADPMAKHLDQIDVVDRDLTLDGLMRLAKRTA